MAVYKEKIKNHHADVTLSACASSKQHMEESTEWGCGSFPGEGGNHI
ncbi:hypothetical protein NSU18_05760 [Paenibacillus sp. FSL H8-0048]